MIQQLFREIEHLKAEIRRLRGELQRLAIGGVIIPTAQGGTASVPSALLGAIIRGTSTGWERLAASAPASGLRNVLGMDNGDTAPSYKALLDNTNPSSIDIGDAAAPGTSLLAARRDHGHAFDPDVEDFSTSETDPALVLHPDGTGGIEWGADEGGGGGGGGGDATDVAIPYHILWTDLTSTHPGLPDETSAARIRVHVRIPSNWDGTSNVVIKTDWFASSTGLADLEDGIFQEPDTNESAEATIQAFANNNLTWTTGDRNKTITTTLLAASVVAGDWFVFSFRRGTGDANTGELRLLGASVRTGLTGVINGNVAAFVGARAYNDANQNVNDITTTYLALNQERYDTDVFHDLVTNNSRLTAPATGWYHIGGVVEWASNATGERSLWIVVNRTTILALVKVDAVNGDTTHQNVSCDYQLAAGDYVELAVYQNSTGTRVINSTSARTPEFWIHKIESGGHVIQDDDSDMTNRSKLSFQDGFVVTDDAGGDQTELDLDYATTTEIADVSDAAESAGTSPKVARGDHKHDLAISGFGASYGPVWTADGTAPSLGDGTLNGYSITIGKLVFWTMRLAAGSTTTFGTGQWRFTLPSTPNNNFAFAGWAFDSSAGQVYACSARGGSGSGTTSNACEDGAIVNTNPFTWANGDAYEVSGWYTIA